MAGTDLRFSTIVASHFQCWRRQRGFTMIELITVIILIGILGAMASARFMAKATIEVDTFTQDMRVMLRYGQKAAIAQNRAVYARLNGQNIALCFDAACTLPVPTPAGTNSINTANSSASNCNGSSTWYCEPVPADISYTLAPAAGSSFYFDPKGKPYAASDSGTTDTSTLGQLVITIAGDGSTRPVTVEAETGYVY